MIDSKGIYRKADALIDKYGTRDPLVLAPQLGIQVTMLATSTTCWVCMCIAGGKELFS